MNELGFEGVYSDAGKNSGILKRINFVKNHLSESTIISYGDTFAEINFDDLTLRHKLSKAVMTIVLTSIRHPFGLVEINKKGKIIKFEEKPILNHFIGYAVIEPELFDILPESYIDLSDGEGIVSAIKYLISIEKLNVYKFGGLQLSINTKKELKEATEKIGNYFTLRENEK